MPGGDLLYAAAGLGVWDSQVGCWHVGEDYPQEWYTPLRKHGWDIRGIHILAEHSICAISRPVSTHSPSSAPTPVTHFAA